MGTKVTFTLAADVVAEATSGLLLGEFNNWDYNSGISLKKQKDGSMKAATTLEEGKTYQYRYLLNDGRWVNDERAQHYVHISDFQVENCVITVPAEAETKTPKVKKASAKPKAEVKEKEKEADDLTKIEGIGRKINELLLAENISNFKDLSKCPTKKLKGILDAAGNKFKMHNPGTWPAQAKLAAEGKWAELEELQKELTGGK
jgi:predicted flap endonuclease-1-like 5' DNA nuclease